MKGVEKTLVVPSSVPEAEWPAISLHLLVKNGETVVGRLLDCVGPYITEVVAVLNDCEDGTEGVLFQKAAEHGLARCEIVEVAYGSHSDLYILDVPETYQEGQSLVGEKLSVPYTGEPILADYAAVRNVGWKKCLGEWRLFLDADDVVDDPSCLPGLCLALAGQGVDVASSRYFHDSPAGGFRERLARNLPQIVWEGIVHEKLAGFDPARAAHVEGSLVVHDLLDNQGKGTRPPWRNLKILYHYARSKDWQITSREMTYLAAESRVVMPDLSKRLAENGAARSGWPMERAWACSIRGQVAEAERQFSQAAEWYRRSISEYPSAGVALRLARVCFYEKQWNEVVKAHELSVRHRDVLQLLDSGEIDRDPVEVLVAAALVELGRCEEAAILCRGVRERRPRSTALSKLLQEIEFRII